MTATNTPQKHFNFHHQNNSSTNSYYKQNGKIFATNSLNNTNSKRLNQSMSIKNSTMKSQYNNIQNYGMMIPMKQKQNSFQNQLMQQSQSLHSSPFKHQNEQMQGSFYNESNEKRKQNSIDKNRIIITKAELRRKLLNKSSNSQYDQSAQNRLSLDQQKMGNSLKMRNYENSEGNIFQLDNHNLTKGSLQKTPLNIQVKMNLSKSNEKSAKSKLREYLMSSKNQEMIQSIGNQMQLTNQQQTSKNQSIFDQNKTKTLLLQDQDPELQKSLIVQNYKAKATSQTTQNAKQSYQNQSLPIKSQQNPVIQDCYDRNKQSFTVNNQDQEDYHNYLISQQDTNMRGMLRVLNTPQTGVIKFPYTTSLIQSQYKKEYGIKNKVRQSNFNMEKERMYVKRPKTSVKLRGDNSDISQSFDKNIMSRQAQNDQGMMKMRKSIDESQFQDQTYQGMYIKIGDREDSKNGPRIIIKENNGSEVNPKNAYITTTRDAFQDPLKSSFVRSQSTKHGREQQIHVDLDQQYPFPKHSLYRGDFANWGHGVKLVEKRPELPRYNLKFKGQSYFKEQCEKSDEMWQEIKEKRNFHANMDTQYQKMLKLRASMGSRGLVGSSTSHHNFNDLSSFHNNNNSSLQNQESKDYFITSKMKNDQKIEDLIEKQKRAGEKLAYGFYQGQQMIRPKSALETGYTAQSKLRASSQHFQTSYKKNFIEVPKMQRPLYVPYP